MIMTGIRQLTGGNRYLIIPMVLFFTVKQIWQRQHFRGTGFYIRGGIQILVSIVRRLLCLVRMHLNWE